MRGSVADEGTKGGIMVRGRMRGAEAWARGAGLRHLRERGDVRADHLSPNACTWKGPRARAACSGERGSMRSARRGARATECPCACGVLCEQAEAWRGGPGEFRASADCRQSRRYRTSEGV